MTHFGAVIVDKNLDKTFYGQLNGLDGTVNDHYRVDIIKPSHESIGDAKQVMFEVSKLCRQCLHKY
jgi:hypothetical protein